MSNLTVLENHRQIRPFIPDSISPLLQGKAGPSRFTPSGEYAGAIEVWSSSVMTEAQLAEAERTLTAIEHHIEPASVREVAGRIEALLALYWVPDAPQGQAAIIASYWIEDLEDIPSAALQHAIRGWRRVNPRKRPTPGEIRALALEQCGADMETARRLKTLIEHTKRETSAVRPMILASIQRMIP